MENELSYLSEKIQGLGYNIVNIEMALEKKFGVEGSKEKSHRQQIKEMKAEKTLLENILNRLTEAKLSKQKNNKLKKFKQWILCIFIGCLFPKLAYALDKLLIDSKEWADDWGRDYDEYDYVKIAKRYRDILKKQPTTPE